MNRFWSKVKKADRCWLWQANCPDGYGQFSLGGSKIRAHRYSWELAYGPIPKDLLVLHKCDTPACVRPDHLFLGTVFDNIADKLEKRRQARGNCHGRTKLKEADFSEIARRHRSGQSQLSIGRAFGISQSHVSRIVCGYQWVDNE